MMHVFRGLFLLSILLLPQLCAAALSSLPFISERLPFVIQLEQGGNGLVRLLEEGLRTQRRESEEFRLLRTQNRAAQFDRDILQSLLKSEGYYDAQVRVEYEEDQLVYQIEAGPIYRIAALTVNFPEGVAPPIMAGLPIAQGDPLRAEAVQAGERAVRNFVSQKHCLYEINLRYHAQINHRTRQAFVQYELAPSPQVNFARPQLIGLESIQPDHLMNYLTFSEGDCFRRIEIERTRMQLLQTNLLAQAEPVIASPEDGTVVVTFELTERHHRTLTAGLGFESNTGAGVTLGWQHRNLIDRGEALDIRTQYAEYIRGVNSTLTVSHYWVKNQTLILHADIEHETPETEAYVTTTGEFGATLSRTLPRHWSGSLGTAIEFSRERTDGERTDYALFSTPMSLEYRRTDDLLNPTRGLAATIRTRPFINAYDTGVRFIKTTLSGSTYLTNQHWPTRPTIALRAATGTITGVNLDTVPKHHRYYVGGGGSVRGYSYQSVGPFDEERAPTGGLSFSETSLELRLRFGESWGAVLFADGGYAYPGERPEFGQDFLWGAGIGLRYYTAFAPFRLDIATPLNARPDPDDPDGGTIDQSVQLYISIGQSF